MASKRNRKSNPGEQVTYQIRVQSHLNLEWGSWYEGITLTLEETGDTLLSCSQMDQSGLYGLLKKVRDSGLLLISVERIKADNTNSFPSDNQ